MLDWAIIGGGPQGVLFANALMHQKAISASRVRIIDPYPVLLHRWNRMTANTGMRYMRSPQVHHVDIDPYSLQQFADNFREDQPAFIPPYQRPSYGLFQAHTRHVIERGGLDRLHEQATALHLKRQGGGWCLETDKGSLHARRVVLATGRNQLHFPDWTKFLPQVQHVLSLDFNRSRFHPGERIAVIGRGISAGQVALSLVNTNDVTLIARGPLRQHDFDSSPCWLGPACLKDFGQADYSRRRWMIGEARKTGTMPQDIFRDVMAAHEEGNIIFQHGEVASAASTADGNLQLTLADRRYITVDHIILATGFKATPPSETWLCETIAIENLPISDCGYPLVERHLRWGPGLYVLGPLSELEVGPAAANLGGGRIAVKRICDSL